MSARAKLISSIVLAAIALAVWKFRSPPAELPRVEAPQPAAEPASTPLAPVKMSEPAATPTPVSPGQEPTPTHHNPSLLQPAEPAAEPGALNERTLVGTKWEREGFGLEFGADGKLLIGGRERARWQLEGSRIRLYRDTTSEEHWLDIVGDKLMWEGQEIGRVP
jgi:hypothetical protein